jgi:hypothetical protein
MSFLLKYRRTNSTLRGETTYQTAFKKLKASATHKNQNQNQEASKAHGFFVFQQRV